METAEWPLLKTPRARMDISMLWQPSTTGRGCTPAARVCRERLIAWMFRMHSTTFSSETQRMLETARTAYVAPATMCTSTCSVASSDGASAFPARATARSPTVTRLIRRDTTSLLSDTCGTSTFASTTSIQNFFFFGRGTPNEIMSRLPTLYLTIARRRPVLLGRWCHPNSHPQCDQERKADLANQDNSFYLPSPAPRRASRVTRDPVSVLAAE